MARTINAPTAPWARICAFLVLAAIVFALGFAAGHVTHPHRKTPSRNVVAPDMKMEHAR